MNYIITPLLKKKLKKMFKKENTRYEKLMNKIEEIYNSDSIEINHYKNLKFPMQNQKRVHIDSSFVLAFEFDQNKKLIIFVDFDHHDKIYKKK